VCGAPYASASARLTFRTVAIASVQGRVSSAVRCNRLFCGAQSPRASANLAPSGIWSGGRPEAASSLPLKLKKETRAVISQIACSFQPAFRSNPISSSSTRLGVSVSLLA
jgi:hypothetical protein